MNKDIKPVLTKLNVWETTLKAYAFIWQQKFNLIKFGLIPFVLLFHLDLIPIFGVWVNEIASVLNMSIAVAEWVGTLLMALILSLTKILVVTAFSIVWHRIYLKRSETQYFKNLLLWKSRHLKFVVIAISLGILSSVVTLPLYYLGPSFIKIMFGPSYEIIDGSPTIFRMILEGTILTISILIVVGFITARFSIMFPSIAVDHPITFRESWNFTSSNGLRIWGIVILAASPLVLMKVTLVYYLLWIEIPVITYFTTPTFEFLTIAVGISALSIAYRTLSYDLNPIEE